MSPISQLGKSMVLASAAVLAMSGVAYAAGDDVVDSIAASGPGNAPGIVNLTYNGTQTVQYWIVADGTCDVTPATPATVTLTVTPSAGLTLSQTTLTFQTCGVAAAQGVTYTGDNDTTTATTHSVTAAGDVSGISGGDKNLGEIDARLTVNVGAGPGTPTNPAPTVAVAAPDAIGVEGDTLSTGGTFADDAAFASITPSSAVGNFSANLTTGVWTWNLPTTDDVTTADLTVTATDAGGLTVSDTFSYGAANADPVIGDITVTQADACSISLSALFDDAGDDDTHASSIDWGDGSAATVDDDPAANPVEGTHTYTSNDTFTAIVTVTDDDGGSDTASADGFTTQNTPSAIRQPINATGTKSVFKIGSTIPVKITVTGCDGAAVTDLTPTVTLYKLDGVPNPGDLETATSTIATNGLQMRWSDTQYIYNLSTKLSQQYGTTLAAGSYRVSVDDPSFFSRTTADFELKK